MLLLEWLLRLVRHPGREKLVLSAHQPTEPTLLDLVDVTGD